MHRLPYLLLYARLVLGPVLLLLQRAQIPGFPEWAAALLVLGLLTDVFDGIIARRLGVSTTRLRRLDSTVDQVFFLSVAATAWLQCPAFFNAHAIPVLVLLGLEALTYGASYWKFRKEIATHSIGAKLWTLLLVGCLVQVLLRCDSGWLFGSCIVLGILTRLEILGIILLLRQWTNDVPSLYHAWQLRRHQPIKRHRWFNG